MALHVQRPRNPHHQEEPVKPLTALSALAALTACTPAQQQAWTEWHAQDPAAAEAFADRWVAEHQAQQVSSRYGVAVWDRIARCESGGNWSHPPVTNSSGTYSGGLMIGHRWWGANGGNQYAAYPYQATKAEQIAVAENIADDIGLDRGWQCYP
jgi:hypothetical protein